MALEIAAHGAGARDPREDFLADGVRWNLSGPADIGQCVGGTVACFVLDLAPVRVVADVELREHATEGVVTSDFDTGTHRRGREFVAAALEDTSLGDDGAEEVGESPLALLDTGLHALLGLPTLVGLWLRALVDRVGSGGVAGERVADRVGVDLGQQYEHDGTLGAGLRRGFLGLGLGDVPFVADPDRDVGAVDSWFVVSPVAGELAGSLAVTVDDLQTGELVVDRLEEQFVTEVRHTGGVIED